MEINMMRSKHGVMPMATFKHLQLKSEKLFEAPGKTLAQELRLFCPQLPFQGKRRPLRHKTVGLQIERK